MFIVPKQERNLSESKRRPKVFTNKICEHCASLQYSTFFRHLKAISEIAVGQCNHNALRQTTQVAHNNPKRVEEAGKENPLLPLTQNISRQLKELKVFLRKSSTKGRKKLQNVVDNVQFIVIAYIGTLSFI